MITELKRNPESELHHTSKIELNFFRHDEKGKLQPGQTDYELSLTDAGKLHAKSKALLKSIDQAVAFGSPRQRAQETAGLQMAGRLDDITGEETLEELRAKIDGERKYGTKLSADKRLDFDIDITTPFGKRLQTEFKAGRYLNFLVEESDALAEKNNDDKASTYGRMAAGIASIIKKYVKASRRFDQLVNDGSKQYQDEMQRYLGTHQGVSESFLAKVTEKIKGIGARNKFIEVVTPGFDFSEGFKVEIINNGSKNIKLRIIYNKIGDDTEKLFAFDEVVPIEVIEEIADEK